jgi:hypothetical protein
MSNAQYKLLIATLLEAMNAHDSDAVVSCFTDQAVVHDEGREHHGLPAIKAWIADAFERYQLKIQVIDTTDGDEEITFNAWVFGTFDGSPIQLLHRLTIQHGKIASLTITPAV